MFAGFDSLDDSCLNGVRLMSIPTRHKRKHFEGGFISGQVHSSNVASSSQDGQQISGESGAIENNTDSSMLEMSSIGDDVQRSFNSVFASLDGMAHNLNVNFRVATVMSQYYAVVRKLKLPRGFDLNESAPDSSESSGSSVLCGPSIVGKLPSPWELGSSWSYTEARSSDLIRKLHDIRDDDR